MASFMIIGMGQGHLTNLSGHSNSNCTFELDTLPLESKYITVHRPHPGISLEALEIALFLR